MKPREYIYAFMFGIMVVCIIMCTAYSFIEECKQLKLYWQRIKCKKQNNQSLDLEEGDYVVLE